MCEATRVSPSACTTRAVAQEQTLEHASQDHAGPLQWALHFPFFGSSIDVPNAWHAAPTHRTRLGRGLTAQLVLILARLFSSVVVSTTNASAMHDGYTVVHACEWLTLITVPLDLPTSLDVVLFNVTPWSRFFFDCSHFYLVETASCVKSCLPLQPYLCSVCAYRILLDSILFLGINTSHIFFRLHLFLDILNICICQHSAIDFSAV